jgi:hypothetical protein
MARRASPPGTARRLALLPRPRRVPLERPAPDPHAANRNGHITVVRCPHTWLTPFSWSVRKPNGARDGRLRGGGFWASAPVPSSVRYSMAPQLWHHPPPVSCPVSPLCAPQALLTLPPPADQRPSHHSRTYLARFQTNCNVPPTVGVGLMNRSSSAVREVTMRFGSVPIRFANVPPSIWAVMTFSASLTVYFPK